MLFWLARFYGFLTRKVNVKKSALLIAKIIFSLSLLVIVLILPENSAAVNLRGYFPGDWVSYTKTRYVRTIDVGFSNVYFGTTEGILVYDMDRDEWKDPITRSDGLPDQNIEMIAVEPDDSKIYVRTPSGYYQYEYVFEEWSPLMQFPMELYSNDLSRVQNLQTYIPPIGYHLFAPNTLQGPELRDYQIVAASETRSGDFWLGTWGRGVAKIESYGLDFELDQYGLYNSDCRAIYRSGETMYFGGRATTESENALTVWDRDSDEWKYYEARYTDRFTSDYINDIIGAGDYIFLATDYGLVKINAKTGSFRAYTQPQYLHSDIVLSLEYNRGHLYFGTDMGMYDLDIKKDSIRYMGGTLIGDAAVLDIKFYKGDLWVGTDNGAMRYDFGTNRFYRYSSTGGALLRIITDIEENPEGGLWFAGEDGVLLMDDHFEESDRFYTQLDLDGFMPNKILVSERYLWIGTDNGLYRYNRVKKDWAHYTEDDGLIYGQIFDLLLEDDYLWIATAEGVTRFYWNNPLRGQDY